MEKLELRRLLKFNKHCLSATTVAPATLGQGPKTPGVLRAHVRAHAGAQVRAHMGAHGSHLNYEVAFFNQ